jgi:methyl-accepting chemotaxis protein
MKQQIQKSVLSYAFFRPESAVVIAITIIFVGLSLWNLSWFPGKWWLWLLFGLVGEALIMLTTLRDEGLHKQVMDKMFHQEFDINKLHSPDLRQKLSEALEYRDSIVKEIEREEEPVLDDYLSNVAHGLEDWIAQVYRLAQGLDVYQHDSVIARDMETVPEELEKFEKLLDREKEGSVREELEKTVAIKRSQRDTLDNLRDTMTKAQLQLENTLAAMSTVYTQVVLLGAKDVNSSRAQRLQEGMTEQISALEDISTTMDEVYQTSSQLEYRGGTYADE